ncbi:MAG: adenosylmethionine--8-amino-7-oxononanoate transaminase [Thermodesulfobacteriota bacterium]
MKKRSKLTEKLTELDKRHVWHPFTQMQEWAASENLIIERGEGNYLIDTDGNRYLDGVSSLWVTVHGHNNRKINHAIKAQLGKVAHSTLLGLSNVPSIKLAARLAKITPGRLNKVFYSDCGSTAVEIALKIAFQYHKETEPGSKRNKFLAFTGAYHGDTFGSMSVGEIGVFSKKFSPLLKKNFYSPYPYCYRCPLSKEHPSCKLACLGEFEEILKEHSSEIAACVIEPLVQGAAGIITSPPGFLKGVRALTKKYGVLLIADEVATGFGRTGRMFACAHERVSPDIMCLAKGLTGGYLPLAATLTTTKIFNAFLGRYDEFKAFFHGHTYTGNPLAAAAALASLDIFEEQKVIERLKPKTTHLTQVLKPLKELATVGEVRQRGLMVGIELVADKKTKKRFPPGDRTGHRICMSAREKGLIIRPLGDTIVLMPPLSITKRELTRMANILRSEISAINIIIPLTPTLSP